MREYLKGRVTPYYETDNELLLLGDTLALLSKLQPGCVDLVFADPPYFLSNGGITCQGGKMVPVDKGDWDKAPTPAQKHSFNRRWIRRCRRVLSDNGTIWISGTLHNIYSIGMALEQEGFKILNNITWEKTNPPPNLACRCFTHSTETVIWARKDEKGAKHLFHYELMKERNGGKQMKDVWTGPLTPPGEKRQGRHPTQKPLYLLERILEAASEPGDLVLDPFCGSSSTGVAAKALGRRYIGIDSEQEYLDLSRRRLEERIAGA